MTERTATYTVSELASMRTIPVELTTADHLIWNAPATIDFNSPGAQGFGVKRAGLTIPGSLMLLISPAACGRNTNALTGPGRYGERFAYLELTSTDIVTGAHLSKIPEAARLFLESRKERPSCLLLCTTCVDALLGTDMERVCRNVEAAIHIPTRPCYMYALTRESLHPPMVQVREMIYGLLTKCKKDPRAANLLGFFSPIDETGDLFDFLHACGIRTIRQLSTCKSYEDFQHMAEANFNLVLNAEALPAAERLAKTLQIPYIALQRFYAPDHIHKQYQALATAIGTMIDDAATYQTAKNMVQRLDTRLKSITPTISIGSRLNAHPLELALVLTSCGFQVQEIFTTISEADAYYLEQLARVSPTTKICGNLSPDMAFFDVSHPPAITIGADAAAYYPDTPNIPWNDELQPFGYRAFIELLQELTARLSLASS